jgi:O-antigen ligase
MNMRWQSPRSRRWALPSTRSMIILMTCAVMTIAICLGGASRSNMIELQIIELASLPLLAFVVWRLASRPVAPSLKVPLWLLAATFAILIIQIIPLPDPLWSKLPGHGQAATIRHMAGLKAGWSPISLLPAETLSHLLALLPPTAVFLGVASLRSEEKRWLTLIPLSLAIVSVTLGAAQIAGGPDSPLYFYEHANTDSAVGLFVNRNHQASLLVTSLPLASLWINLDRRQMRQSFVPVAFAMGLFLVEIVALIVVKSRAGVLLLGPAILASLMLVWRSERGEGKRGATLLGGVIAITLVVAAAIAIGPVMDRFANGGDLEEGGRFASGLTTARAALEYLPFGSGSGTFVPVFAGHENIDYMGPKYWNHAHNEFIEIFLETGLAGLAALLGFFVWIARQTLRAWASPSSLDANLACAGSIVVGLLLLHSTVDFPLRTLTMATVFAFACALMVSPPEAANRSRR